MIKTAKILYKIPTFYCRKWKGTQKKGNVKNSMMSLLKETVKDSLKNQDFGVQKQEKPKKTFKNQKEMSKSPQKFFENPRNSIKKPRKFENIEKHRAVELENDPNTENLDFSGSESESLDIKPTNNIRSLNPLNNLYPEKGPSNDYFSIDFLQFPWKFNNSYIKPQEKNLQSPIPLDKILYENDVFLLIKNFLLSMEDFDYDTLSEVMEPSFYKKLMKNLEKLKNSGYKIEIKNLKKSPYLIDIYNVSSFFTIGLQENRLKNDSLNYYDVKDANIQGVSCKNIIHKSLLPEHRTSIILQIDCAIESEIAIEIKDGHGLIVKECEKTKKIHLFKLEMVLMDEKYEDFTKMSLEFEQNKLDMKTQAKKLKKKRYYLIDFDEFMNGNPLLRETIDRG